MLVLLKDSVNNLGARGDVVTVADGYARNFLVPRGLGVVVKDREDPEVLRTRRQLETSTKKVAADSDETVEKVRGMSLTISARATDEGHLYGSISERDIVAALAENGVELEASCIEIEEHIKEVGVYTVSVILPGGTKCPLKVWILSEQSIPAEAQGDDDGPGDAVGAGAAE